jgi:hypothetical protein
MSTNKKFRIQNGLDVTGEVVVGGVTVINADGTVVSDVSDQLVPLQADVAALETSIANILGTSPETLDTLQELVAAYESADADLTVLVTQTSQAVTDLENSVGAGAALTVTSQPTTINYEESLGSVFKIFASDNHDQGILYSSNNYNSVTVFNRYNTSNSALQEEGFDKSFVTSDAFFLHHDDRVIEYPLDENAIENDQRAVEYVGWPANEYSRMIYADDDVVALITDDNMSSARFRVWTRGDGYSGTTIAIPTPAEDWNHSWGRTITRAGDYFVIGGSRGGSIHNLDGSFVKYFYASTYFSNTQDVNFGGDNKKSAVASYGNTLVIGCPNAARRSGIGATGAILIFDMNDFNIMPTVVYCPTPDYPNDKFGYSVDVTADRIYVSAPGINQTNGDHPKGRAFVLELDGTLVQEITDPNPNSIYRNFAYFLGVSGTTLAIAAEGYDNSIGSKGGIYLYDTEDLASGHVEELVYPGTDLDYPKRFHVTTAELLTQAASDVIVPSSGVVPAINYLEDKTNDMQTEINALTGQDTSLSTSIDANTAAITAETARAQAAESANWNAIQNEITRATAVEDANTSAISDESVARAAGDSALQSQIDAIVGTSPETLDTLQEIVAAFEGADSDLQAVMTANASTISELESAIGSNVSTDPNLPASFSVDGYGSGYHSDFFKTISGESYTISGNNSGSPFYVRVIDVDGNQLENIYMNPNGVSWSGSFTGNGSVVKLQFYIDHENPQSFNSVSFSGTTGSAGLETTATTVFGAVNELHTELQTLAGLDTSIVSDVSANTQAIADEVARATAAEASLSTSISNESTARNTAVSGLQSQVTSNASAITAEESRALAAEAGLATQIAAESTARDSAISAEASLREAGDAALQAAIDASVSTTDLSVSGTATFEGGINVGSNGGSIGYDDTSEDIQMMSDVDMQGNLIHNLGTPVDATDAASKSYVDGRISDVIGGSVESLDTIQEVVAAFESADSDIQGLIAANTANHATNAAAISAESTARQTADTTLQGNIDAEASARSAADSNLQASIDAEVARATAAEAQNATDIDSLESTVGSVDVQLLPSSVTANTYDTLYTTTVNTVIGQQYTISFDYSNPDKGFGFYVWSEAGNINNADIVDENFSSAANSSGSGSRTYTFTATSETTGIAVRPENNNSIPVQITNLSMPSPAPTLNTTAQVVIPAINEVLAAVNSSSTASASDLAAETAARIAGDSDVTASLAGETAARIAGDGSLQSQIDAVESAVQAITSGSVASLDTLVEVVSAFENADSDLQALMTANSSSISGVDTRVGTLETEMDAVEGVASANASLLSTHSSSIAGLDSDVSSLQSFTGQGTALGTAAVSLAAAINEIHNELNSVVADLGVETARAAAKENSLDSDIDDETAARIAGDAGLQSQIDSLSTSLTDEGTGRDSDVASLQSQINSIVSNTDSAALDSLTEIVAAFQSADGSLSQLITNNQTDITSHNTRIGVIEAWTTDNLPEGSVNKYFNDSDVKACLSGGLCIDYDASTGVIAIDEAEAATSLKTAESFASDDASKLEGQAGSYYRIDVYDINGSVVN